MEALFGKQAYKLLGKVREKQQTGEPLTGLEGMVAQVMKEHPEFEPFWDQGERMAYPQEIEGSVVNPLVHTGLHVVVEKQIREDDPEEVRLVLGRLEGEGKSRHEALHVVAQIWGSHYFQSVRRGNPMEELSYIEALKVLL
jgi:hypothetical protein